MMKLEPDCDYIVDPWESKKLEDFLCYQCPECHFTSQDTDNFLIHCHQHPLAKKFIDFVEGHVQNHTSTEQQYQYEEEEEELSEEANDDAFVEPATFVDCSLNIGSEALSVPPPPPPQKKRKKQFPMQNALPFPLPPLPAIAHRTKAQ